MAKKKKKEEDLIIQQVKGLREEINALMIYLDAVSNYMRLTPYTTSIDNVWNKAVDEWNEEVLIKDAAHELTSEILCHALSKLTSAVKDTAYRGGTSAGVGHTESQ